VCSGGDIEAGSISPRRRWVSVSLAPSRRSGPVRLASGSASPQLRASPAVAGYVSQRNGEVGIGSPARLVPSGASSSRPRSRSPPPPPTNGFDGETNPTRAAQESPTSKGKPRVVDVAGVGWSPYYFSKLL
jgi:hypothetical protein